MTLDWVYRNQQAKKSKMSKEAHVSKKSPCQIKIYL